MLNKVWCLQLFADEGGTDVSADSTPNATGVESGDAAQSTGETSDAADQSEVTENPETTEVSFDDLIADKYKDDFDKKVQGIVQKRVKKYKGLEQQLNEANERSEALQPMMEMLGEKYGVDPSDVEALTNALTNDNALYEEEALERGMDVETLKQIKSMEMQNRRLQAQQEAHEMEQQQLQEFARIEQEAEELKEIYPDFDLEEELQNEEFAKMLHLGFSVQNTFESLHLADLKGLQAQAIEQKAVEKVTNSIKANAKRPNENGLKSQPGNKVSNDISSLSKNEIDDYIRRATSGESITF